ncbi:hypothetical protein SAMN05192564_102303 [Paraburkholderia sartisoli]|uniref:Uncharacterized protein n=1 Tax=Paraburkholderia sartisoli TaxID=83784 RepID=A0A1H4CGR4_9BURK|nr:hypothetical protein SAMN05192564_102303 [Paraburkholderia sartisoli]
MNRPGNRNSRPSGLAKQSRHKKALFLPNGAWQPPVADAPADNRCTKFVLRRGLAAGSTVPEPTLDGTW